MASAIAPAPPALVPGLATRDVVLHNEWPPRWDESHTVESRPALWGRREAGVQAAPTSQYPVSSSSPIGVAAVLAFHLLLLFVVMVLAVDVPADQL